MVVDLQTQMKQAVATAAVNQVRDGMVVGLGSGSTAAFMIHDLGSKLASGKLHDVVGITTSFQSEVIANAQQRLIPTYCITRSSDNYNIE